jgi:outer membrane immunogenic protein
LSTTFFLGFLMTKLISALAALLLTPAFAAAQAIVPASGSNSANASSWMAGAQAGYNWQRGSLVYGLEADISGTGLKTGMNTILQNISNPLPTASTVSSIDWYGTVRGRLGWAAGPVMVYGTGGLAYGRTGLNSTLFDNANLTSLNSQSTSVKTGWVAGFGVDYLWRPNLVLNLGYQYVDLGTTSLTASSPGGLLNQSVSARGQFQVVSVGLSWLFPPAGPVLERPRYSKAPQLVVSEPWNGFYVGGHAGGAWGNSTNASYSDTRLFSDARLKRDIVLVGRRDDGLGMYAYKYLWSEATYVGVMAQEVALIYPHAVVRDPLNGYLAVDYARLGVRPLTQMQ